MFFVSNSILIQTGHEQYTCSVCSFPFSFSISFFFTVFFYFYNIPLQYTAHTFQRFAVILFSVTAFSLFR